MEVRLTGNARGAVSAINATERELRELDRTGDRLSGLGKRVLGGLAALGIGHTVVSGFKAAVSAAGEFQQSQNVLQATIGASATEMGKLGQAA